MYKKVLLAIVFTALLASLFIMQGGGQDSVKNADILLLGDSITAGMFPYMDLFESKTGFSGANEGVNGFDTIDLYNALEQKLQNYNPKVIVLAIGINNWIRVAIDYEPAKKAAYIKERGYGGLSSKDIQMDSARGEINSKGVAQIISKIRELYGADHKILLVNAFPTKIGFNSDIFDAQIKEITTENEGVELVDVAALASIGWSKDSKEFYDYPSSDKAGFASTHVDWGHLNERGYMIYISILHCALEGERCSGAVDASFVNRMWSIAISK